jgi:hypothetical protein
MDTVKLWPYLAGCIAMTLLLGVLLLAGLRPYLSWPSRQQPVITMVETPFALGHAWPDDNFCAVLPDLFRCFVKEGQP